ncbi:MAG: MarR family transcriptional regulator [Rhodospirillaceae bacterium]
MPKPALRTVPADAADYQLSDQVGFMLRQASQRHVAIFAERIPDLTPTQFAALARLCEVGAVSQNELGRRTSMDAATIKGVIDRLRKRGFVASEPDPGDQRRILVSPTDAGRRTFAELAPAAEAISAETLAPLTAGERAQVLRLLAKLT